jgi:hypothetical protein
VPESNLTPKQAQAIAALMTMPTVKAAAKSCGMSYSALRAWLHDETFLHELRQAQSETIAGTMRALTSVMAESVTVLGKLLKSKNASIRLGAVRIAQTTPPALLDLCEHENRLQALEERMNVNSKLKPTAR